MALDGLQHAPGLRGAWPGLAWKQSNRAPTPH
jgi:hypothetical protein